MPFYFQHCTPAKKTNLFTDSNQTINTSLLVGKWYTVEDSIRDYRNGKLYQFGSLSHPWVIDATLYFQFNSDNTGIFSFGEAGARTFTYSVSGNKVTLSAEGEPSDTPTIRKLTSNDLQLYIDETTIEDGDTIRHVEAGYYVKR